MPYLGGNSDGKNSAFLTTAKVNCTWLIGYIPQHKSWKMRKNRAGPAVWVDTKKCSGMVFPVPMLVCSGLPHRSMAVRKRSAETARRRP